MLEFRINGLPVVIKSGLTFTLNSENPFFTNSEDSTYQVTLPLSGCPENLRIFGPLHRCEYSKTELAGKKYSFTLFADMVKIEGQAVITSIDDNDVKVQLLAGASSFNYNKFLESGKDKYIDELDLGKAFDAYCKYDENNPYLWRSQLHNYLHTLTREPDYEKMVFIAYSELNKDCVFYPIMSGDGQTANKRNLFTTYVDDHGAARKVRDQYLLNRPNEEKASADTYVAPQPYFMNIINRVVKALGFNVVRNDIDKTWMRNIFIANCVNEVEYRKMLPHWTVREFFDEVCKFFGITIQAVGQKVSVVRRGSYYEDAETVCLNQVIDEYEVNIEDNVDNQDISTANIDYDHNDIDPILRLPEEVWENATISTHYDESRLGMFIRDTVDKQPGRRESSEDLMVVENPKSVKAFLLNSDTSQYDLADVDMCPPLIRDNQYGKGAREIQVHLRIVPAMIEKGAVDLHNLVSNGAGGYSSTELKKNHIAIPLLVSSAPSESSYTNFSVNNAINTNKEGENKEGNAFDNILVGVNYADTWQGQFIDKNKMTAYYDFPMAYGVGWVKGNGGLYHHLACKNNFHQFQLNKKTAPSIYDTVFADNYKIDRRCVHVISFVDKININPRMVFVINNRRYVCQKIVYQIDERGLKDVKKGYFYELN